MQLGLAQLVSGCIALILIVGGAFTFGTKWEARSNETSVAAAATPGIDSISENSFEEDIPAPSGAPLYKVLRVVDGDTIAIEINGKSESLRMIGIDTPELNDSRTGVQCFAKEAADKASSLVSGMHVRIESDASQGERDKYKRLLAYVFREDGVLVNRALIEGGYAYEYTYDESYKYQKEFKEAESRAKSEARGLWAEGVCAPSLRAKSKNAPSSKKSSASKAGQAAAAGAAAAFSSQPSLEQPLQVPGDGISDLSG